MGENIRCVFRGGEGEITEKKSRFIATVRPVHSEEEAFSFVEEMRKKYWDARHNCYAYTVGKNRENTRCSDDGEPSGTAGRPMLDVLLGEELHDTAVVVTRYFGGVLLGTGGLVRAYSAAVQAGLRNSVVIEKMKGIILMVETDYNSVGKILYLTGEKGIFVADSIYTDSVVLKLLVPDTRVEEMKKALIECTSGRAVLTKEKDLCFAVVEGKAEIFE